MIKFDVENRDIIEYFNSLLRADNLNAKRTLRAGLLWSHLLSIVAERLWAFSAYTTCTERVHMHSTPRVEECNT